MERFTWQGPFNVACGASAFGGGCTGSFSIASDNAYALYINGAYQTNVNGGATNVEGCEVALTPSGDPYTGCNWQSVDLHEFSNIPGPVTLAVDALDAGGAGGWIGTAVINGITYDTGPNTAWKCISGSDEGHGQDGNVGADGAVAGWSQVNSGWHGDPPPYGWARAHFDDSDWPRPTSFGGYDSAPWGDINRDMGMDSLGAISTDSQWVWTSDNQAHNDIYCRLTVPCGRPQPPPGPPPPAKIPHVMEGATQVSPGDFALTGSAKVEQGFFEVVCDTAQGFFFQRADGANGRPDDNACGGLGGCVDRDCSTTDECLSNGQVCQPGKECDQACQIEFDARGCSSTAAGVTCDVGGSVLQLTALENSQAGTAFMALPNVGASGDFTAQFQMYCGDGTGADGLCMNLGGNDMGGRVGEDGVAQGVAVCFDEWANGGDHGVQLYYDGEAIWENIGEGPQQCASRALH